MSNAESSPEKPNQSDEKKKLTRRGFIKWTTALGVVGAAAVGLGAGYGADLVLRPNTASTTTETETQTKTQTQNVTQTETQTVNDTTTQTATKTQTQTQTVTQTTTVGTPAPAETVLTSCHDGGPFLAHIVNGRWTRSEPLAPNLPVGINAFAVRNRVYSPDRIRYPMKRVGWAPGGKSDTSNRGKGEFVRITWQEALDSTAAEIQRINTTYGPGAIIHKAGGHQWKGTLHQASWMSNLLAILGGYTYQVGGTSRVGWNDGTPLMWGGTHVPNVMGGGHYNFNNYNDLLQNCKLVVQWGGDGIRTSNYTGPATASQGLVDFHKAGVAKIVVIDSRFTETAALVGDQWIPIIPGTDEAMAAAIAYVWITTNKVNQSYLDTHTVGFDEAHLPAGAPKNSSFKAYIMGDADGVPKTPQWAAGITGVDATTITNLANEWASKPTFLAGTYGPNRREWAGEYCRMMIALQAMLGYLGIPGAGLGVSSSSFPAPPAPTPVNMGRFGSKPSITNPVKQIIHHLEFRNAILNPPIHWTTGVTYDTYPMQGYSEVKMQYNVGGSCANQKENPVGWHEAWMSPKIEFIANHHVWWEDEQPYADIVMPTSHIGEREDLYTFNEFAIFGHQLIQPLYESKSDMEVVMELATRLGVSDKVFQGMNEDQWLRSLYAKAKMPLSYDDFKAQGYIKFDTTPLDTKTTDVGQLKDFYDDPVKNPLNTPTGKIEFYSTSIAKFYGPDGKTMPTPKCTAYPANPIAPPIPMYVPATENRNSALAQKYPLLSTQGGQKFGRHSQWNNLSWLRDDDQTFIHGYRVIIMNTVDADARGLKYGDVVRVFNDRGQNLHAVKVTEMITPGVVWIYEGGQGKPQQPGVLRALDMGGNSANLTPNWQAEPICDGNITSSGLVQVEKYIG